MGHILVLCNEIGLRNMGSLGHKGPWRYRKPLHQHWLGDFNAGLYRSSWTSDCFPQLEGTIPEIGIIQGAAALFSPVTLEGGLEGEVSVLSESGVNIAHESVSGKIVLWCGTQKPSVT